ncbi:MAG: SoxR reducing system RseC family protein [Bacteroidales bacterium]|nr:SoxR reducing system RseC family protein [Candidatus Equibacterium intestinale]
MAEKTPKEILHTGRIVEIGPQVISVEIVNKSACATCHAKGVCGASDEQVRIIDVPQTIATRVEDYRVGEEVSLRLSQSLGLRAVFIAYVVPLMVLMASILVLSATQLQQLYVGIISLAAVAVYYIFVATFRDKLEKVFTFSIEKLHN